ncbi:MAG: hypothetical protein JNL98_09835 [Bryobacterales bacterium]|nr:hypothetical protein [Bryobacterales bacterium]
MRIKSFFADSVEAGMKAAYEELGPEAMVVTSRRASPTSIHLGKYEVVAGLMEAAPGTLPSRATASARPITKTPPEKAPQERYSSLRTQDDQSSLSGQVFELRREVEGLRDLLARAERPTMRPAPVPAPEIAEEHMTRLTASELDTDLARAVVDAAQSRVRTLGGAVRLEDAIKDELARRIVVDPSLPQVNDSAPRVIALVGPPGAGKTSTLIKIAIRCGLGQKRPVQLFSADWVRVGAATQLKTYASLLGISFQHFDSVASLEETLLGLRGPQVVLIDTPGCGPQEMQSVGELAEMLRESSAEIHLVIPASLRRTDLRRQAELYSCFRPCKWVLTKMDETGSLGAAVSEAILANKPFSFLSAGQRIPEDLAPADSRELCRLIFEPAWDHAASSVA